MREETFADARAAAARAAELIAAAAREAVGETGSFSLALSGGPGPRPMYELLGSHEVPWEATDVFQVDERIAPEGDDERNLTHLRALLPDAARGRLRAMPVEEAGRGGDAAKAAASAYGAALPDSLDLVHLGLGPDGHTASLVPGDPVLDVTDRRVALTSDEYQGHRRMTLTYPVLAAARQIVWLVTGEEKGDALAKLRAGDRSIPGGRVERSRAILLTDQSA